MARKKCRKCGGTGERRCPKCHGSNRFCPVCSSSLSFLGAIGGTVRCESCNGTGYHEYTERPSKGSGKSSTYPVSYSSSYTPTSEGDGSGTAVGLLVIIGVLFALWFFFQTKIEKHTYQQPITSNTTSSSWIKEKEIRLAGATAESLARKYVMENAIMCNGFYYIKIDNTITKLSKDISIGIHESDENWTWASFEVWSPGSTLEYREGKGWIESEFLHFGMKWRNGQWVTEDFEKISCSDIQKMAKNERPISKTDGYLTKDGSQQAVGYVHETNQVPWIFSDSDKKYLTDDDVRKLSIDDLWKGRNEIYAKKGYIFKTDRGKQYTESLGRYYSGTEVDLKKIQQKLNAYEKYNVKLIEKYEK